MNMNSFKALCIIAIILFVAISTYLKNPFYYPSITINFDISGKRQPVYEDYIDEWINNLYGHKDGLIVKYNNIIRNWEADCEKELKHSIFWRKHRRRLYEKMRDEVTRKNYLMFNFVFSRNQTRYRQRNYQRQSYIVKINENILNFSIEDLIDIAEELQEFNYETTRRKWGADNQRKLMTKELKDEIKQRDNYTCQMCGKYMPDEVRLHIDHIIPIKEGGKSVASNLQVLCDKCNLSKGKKIMYH